LAALRGEIGFSVGSQTGFYATATVGKGNAHGNGTTYADSSVSASDTLTLISGNDTTIKGAQATGNTVLASIGGNLNLASEQDTDDYASKQWQAGGMVKFGFGGGGSVNVSAGKTDNHYASVTQTSGIGAGDGGYQIVVGGNTDLKGAVIASTADASHNVLNTGTLSYSDIANQASYSAISVSVGGGSGGFGLPGLSVPQGKDASSTTQAAIANGTLVVRNNPSQDVSGLSHDASLDNSNALKNDFDPTKIAEQQQLGQLAGQVGMTAAGDIEQANHWDAGSGESIALHTVAGALSAGLGGGSALGGALGAGVSEAATPWLVQQFGVGALPITSTLLGAIAGGGAGAATAAAGTQYNYLSHSQVGEVKKSLENCASQGGDLGACQNRVLASAEAQSLSQDVLMYLACVTGARGCNQEAITEATGYAANSNLPTGLKDDQVRSTDTLLSYLFGTDDGYKYYPQLEQREDFFQALQNGLDNKGNQVIWPQVAANVSNSLESANAWYCPACGDASSWINQVGTSILKGGWSNFQQVYNSQTPLTGLAAAQWDTTRLVNEQKALQPLYDQLKANGGWGYQVIYMGGFINTHGGDIFDIKNRIEYGQHELNSIGKDGR
jgi:hypothetical protein